MRNFFILMSLFAFVSCTKDSAQRMRTVQGDWQLLAVFDGATQSGCMCWQPIGFTKQQTLRLERNGNFKMTYPPISSVSGCSGTYQVADEQRLLLTTSCWSATSQTTQHAYELKGDTLVVDFTRPNGIFRNKYFRL